MPSFQERIEEVQTTLQTRLDGARKRWDKARLSLLDGILRTTDWLGPRLAHLRPPAKIAPLDWGTGVSVIIPERESPDLLVEALRSARAAGRQIREPLECIVVVNGASLALYRDIARGMKEVRWLHSRSPLGFATAIRHGVRAATYGAVYLLNSDMKLDDGALAEVLAWRRPQIFSVASQIFFADPKRRREETGWADMRVEKGQVVMFHAQPEDPRFVRGHLYGSGGATLFHRETLVRMTASRDPYHPFYFEDAEWGIRAWRDGYESVYCPKSIAWHRHRGTVSRYFDRAEIDRIVERNRMQFQLRNFGETAPREELVRRVANADERTRSEVTSLTNLADLARVRLRRAVGPCPDIPLQWVRRKYYPAPRPNRKETDRCIIVVSPYVVYPPSHGGAVRIARLLSELARTHRVVLLSDEQNAYLPGCEKHFDGLEAVHLIGGRVEKPYEVGKRGARIRTHSHQALSSALARLAQVYRADLVQVEYMELGGLVRVKSPETPWLLALHDVTLAEKDAERTPEDDQELELIQQHDGVIACSTEDAALLGTGSIYVVPNAAAPSQRPYVSSAGRRVILFTGPFRYGPNLEGIRVILQRVYPELRRRVPGVQLWLGCGAGAQALSRPYDEFDQPGVVFLEPFSDPRPILDASAVTLNPQYEIRGSSIKLIESLAAGRVCVSTVDGARGFRDAGFPNLVQVPRIEDFLAPLTWLLTDEAARLRIERPSDVLMRQHDWSSAAGTLASIYDRYIEERRAS